MVALRQLQEQSIVQTLLRWEINALREIGLQPMLDRCVLCKKPLEDMPASQPITWNALAGGVVCSLCPTPSRGRRQLSQELWRCWRLSTQQQDLPLPESSCQQLLDVLHEYWMHQLAKPLRLITYFSPHR